MINIIQWAKGDNVLQMKLQSMLHKYKDNWVPQSQNRLSQIE